MLEVVHDPERPLEVFAGNAEITDIGTKFDVYVQDSSTRVTVLEGQVNVHAASHLGFRVPEASAPLEALLGAGEQVQVVHGEVGATMRVDAQNATAWMRGQIAFEHQPLSDVVAEFNRYNRTPIEIATPGLRSFEISGVFAQDDTESFIAFLRSLDGVEVQVTEDRIRVSRRR